MPEIAIQASVSSAFRMLEQRGKGGVIATDMGHPLYYVTCAFLQHAVWDAASEVGTPAAAMMPVGEYLTRYLAKNARKATGQGRIAPELVPVRIDGNPLQSSDLVAEVENFQVFDIRKDGKAVGWHLNHENLRATVDTEPPVWYCTNPVKKHKNTKFNGGFCSDCPYELQAKKS
jgi:hypothetical protein